MNNKIILVILVVVAVAGLFYFTQKQSSPSQPQTVTEQPQVVAETNTITIQNFSFNPDTLTVKQGTKVTWTNQDPAPHKIKAETFNSSDLNKGATFEFVFDNKGSFDYICSIHPSMKGKIVVE